MNILKHIIHCSFTPASMDIGAKEIKDWHVNGNGWSDIGYHFVIRRNGVLEMGRDRDGDGNILEEIGAHAYGNNKDTIGTCMVGGKAVCGGNENNFTPEQFTTLKSLAFLIREISKDVETVGHYEVDKHGKTCPNFDVPAFLKSINYI